MGTHLDVEGTTIGESDVLHLSVVFTRDNDCSRFVARRQRVAGVVDIQKHVTARVSTIRSGAVNFALDAQTNVEGGDNGVVIGVDLCDDCRGRLVDVLANRDNNVGDETAVEEKGKK